MSKILECYWFGYGGSSWMAEKLRYTIENELGMKLTTIHEHPDANIKWDLKTVYKELEKADIIIIPANYRRQPNKSSNRLTQAMALGKPIICEPMPSYVPIVNNFENAIILENDSLDQWRFCLKMLRDNSHIREKLGINAFITSKKFSTKAMTNKWIDLFKEIESKKNEKIDVVIPTKKNIDILKECVKSFSNSSLDETIYIIDNDADSCSVEEMIKSLNLDYEVRYI